MPEVQSRSYANPRRLPRRNHYQEGPGFLFVATQGGRPPDDDGLRNLAGVVRRRRAGLRRWAHGDPLATICAEFRCSRASLFRWRTRFERDGLEGLLDRPRVGRRSDLPTTVERLILTVRLLTYWNSGRIAAEFRRRAVWPLTHGQVDRVLARHGTHRPSYVRTPGPRYERAAANELWHIDLKGPFYFVGATGLARTCHFVALVDDHSRFLLTDPGRPDQAGRSDPRPARGGDRAVRGAARAHDRQRDAVRRDHPHDAQPVPAQPRRARDPPHPDPDRHALDERQDRGVLAHAQAEVLDRQQLADLAAAEAAVTAYAGYYNYHRLHGEPGWRTPAERFDGTPFTDRGFGSVPSLAGVADLLDAILAA
jgi:transposase